MICIDDSLIQFFFLATKAISVIKMAIMTIKTTPIDAAMYKYTPN